MFLLVPAYPGCPGSKAVKRSSSLHVTCGLTACTPGSAPGPTLGNEYGKTLPFTFFTIPSDGNRFRRKSRECTGAVKSLFASIKITAVRVIRRFGSFQGHSYGQF